MNSSLVKEYIDTVAALSRFVQSKRFHVNEDVIDILESPVALSINDEIKMQYGLDLASIESEDRLLEYGEHLQNKLIAVIKESYFNSSLKEEIELIETAQEVSKEDYLKNNLDNALKNEGIDAFRSYSKANNFVRAVIDSIGVTVPSYLYSIKHPEKIHLIDLRSGSYPADGVKHYLVSSKLRVKNKDIFVLTDLVESTDKPLELHAWGCFFFEQSNKRVSSPIRMFLQGVNEYGNEINLEGVKKSFFLQRKVENESTLLQDGLTYKKLGYRGEMILFFSISKASGNTIFQFSYMLLQDEIIADVKKRIFL
ncbi:hypothetical protein [Hymenobacter bucti]|uniref:WYL domain-containing protein n=1 Tax=Hymenobacter bucti TaxID=1844114 RepID=A0ABW4QX17_9BACT